MKAYTDSAKKAQARAETLYRPYRERFGWPLAPDRQYITLPAVCANSTGILATSELGQTLSTGFATQDQFHGVDTDAGVVDSNRLFAPQAHWHCADLYEFILLTKREGWLNPGLVNYDSLLMPKKGVRYAADLLLALAAFKNIMLTCNFVLHSRTRVTTVSQTLKMLYALPQFAKALQAGWKFHRDAQSYEYLGTGVNGTAMCSLVFYKR
jgi:hypothetical protein